MNDRCCVTPGGMFDLLTRGIQSLSQHVFNQFVSSPRASFSCNGRCLFLCQDGTLVKRVDPFEPSLLVKYSWKDKERRIVHVGPTSRYLVLGPILNPEAIPEEDTVYIYDTDSNKTIELKFSERLFYWMGGFHFL